MPAIPEPILLVGQIFGAFPLKYSEEGASNSRPILEFSKTLFIKAFIAISVIVFGVYYTLYVDYTGYLNGHPIRMKNSIYVLSVVLDVTFLNLVVITVFVSNAMNHHMFIDMCFILERTDHTIQLEVNNSRLKFKAAFMLLYITALGFHSDFTLVYPDNFRGLLHIFNLVGYYVFTAQFLMFTFVVQSITQRFRVINDKIKAEVLGQSFTRVLERDLGFSKHNSKPDVTQHPPYQLQTLVDLHAQLCKAVELASTFYSSQLFAIMASSFIHIIITFFFLIQKIGPSMSTDMVSQMMSELTWAFTHLAHLILLVWPCTELAEAAAETAPILCQLINRDLKSPGIKKQLETFLLKLLHCNVGFSALGFYDVHSQILTSMASSVTTYLVIMVQFRSPDE